MAQKGRGNGERIRFFHFCSHLRLEDMLSQALHKEVDLQTPSSIRLHIQPFIEKNKVLVYEG